MPRLGFALSMFWLWVALTTLVSGGLGVACAGEAGPDPEGAVDVVHSEVSIYSLPHIVVKHRFRVPDGGVLVSDSANPELRFSFDCIDHSHGTNVDAHIDYEVYEDQAFPFGNEEKWVLVHQMNRVTSNVADDIRRVKEKTFNVHGDKYAQLRLTHADPVRRIRVIAHAKMFNPVTSVLIRKPLSLQEAHDERSFFVVMRPQWAGQAHQGHGMILWLRHLLGLKQDLLRWRVYQTSLLTASRSGGDLARFDEKAFTAVLASPMGRRQDLDTAAADLLSEGDRASGRPAAKIEALRSDLLGIARPSFDYASIHNGLAQRTAGLISSSAPLRNLVVGAAAHVEGAGLVAHIDRLLADMDLVLKGLFYLWGVGDRGEFQSLTASLDSALKAAIADSTALVAVMDDELGRHPQAQTWLAIERSRIFRERYAGDASGDRKAASLLLRGLFSDLLYLSEELDFAFRVAQAVTTRLITGFDRRLGLADGLLPASSPVAPIGLWVDVPASTTTVGPGQVARYLIKLENRTGSDREVSIQERTSVGTKWRTSLSERSLRLLPGQSKNVYFSLSAPVYAHEAVNEVSTVAIAWADEPALEHRPQFLTRLQVGGALAALPGEGTSSPRAAVGLDDVLQVSLPMPSHLVFDPGGGARTRFWVTHTGPGTRPVSVKPVTGVPDRWVLDLKPEEFDAVPGVPTAVDVRVAAPLDLVDGRAVELLLGVAYREDFDRADKLRFVKLGTRLDVLRPRPLVNGGEVRTYKVATGTTTTMLLELTNAGNVTDVFDVVIDDKPKDWYVHLDQKTVRLEAGQRITTLPITARPPPSGLTGEFERISLRLISTVHPEFFTRATITCAVRSPENHAIVPVLPRIIVSPETRGKIQFRVRNVMDRPERFTFRISPATPHPEWFTIASALGVLQPDEEKIISVDVDMPHGVPVDRNFPLVLMALDEHGGEIASGRAMVEVAPARRLHMMIDEPAVTRTRTLVQLPIIVRNDGTADEQVGLLVSGQRRYWARISHRKLFLRPGQEFTVSLTIRLPVEALPSQLADLAVQATSLKDGSVRDIIRVQTAVPFAVRNNASTAGTQTRF